VLTKVTLINFQAHKKLELDCKKFTTLTGGSNGGKTSVLRAVLALVRNDSANDYVRYGQKTLTVILEFEDGYIVEWLKGSGENRYTLTDPTGKSRVFDKVGSECPEEVKDVLKLGPVAIKASDKEYVNFHSQLEAPFIISATPGNVAKLLGELTSASQLYTAVNDGNKEVRATNVLKTTRSEDIKRTVKSLDAFCDLDIQEALLETAGLSLDQARNLATLATDLLKEVDREAELVTRQGELGASIQELYTASKISLDELLDLEDSTSTLQGLIEGIETFNVAEKKGIEGIEYLEDAINQDLAQLEGVASASTGLELCLGDLGKLDSGRLGLEGLISSTSADILSMMTGLDELLQSVDTCPKCGQELSEDARDMLLAGGDVHVAH